MDRNEIISSINTIAADIQRWTLQMALTGRISQDRMSDIKHAAARITELNAKLPGAR